MPSRSHVFYGLNAVRVLSIVALLLTFASSIVVVVSDIRAVNKSQHDPNSGDGACGYIEGSTVPNQPAGVFWAVINRLFIIFQVIFLILSEVSWPMAFFDRFFPVLGSQFGLGALGIFQGLIGATILSHHVDKFTLVAAFFLFSIGCLNMALGLIFRELAKSKRSIRAWRSNDDGTLPMHTGDLATPKFHPDLFGGRPADASDDEQSNGFGFGTQGEKQAGLRGFLITKPTEAVSRYTPSLGSSLLSVVEPGTTDPEKTSPPSFRSSPTAI
ncbi:hypothetical protein BJV74DRAFT_4557 [Russula compacta]|nr:hypothetical protein BJV74DRAFT_4557 [Russula compacta]